MRRSLKNAFFVFRIKTSFLVAKTAKKDVFLFLREVITVDFEALYNRISPRLKRIAKSHNGHGFFIDEDDLYQEMCMHLWERFKGGVPEGMNDFYIARGCEFHILNYLRKKRNKAPLISLQEPINEKGGTLEDMLPSREEGVDRYLDRKITISDIKNNGFTKREKEVFSLLLEGYTVREAGDRLGISHVMVVKLKKNLIRKWQKENNGYQNRRIFT